MKYEKILKLALIIILSVVFFKLSYAQTVVEALGHNGSVNSVSYSPDGRYIVSGPDDKTIKIWDANTGSLVRTFDGDSSSVRSVLYSPDGGYIVSGSLDGIIKIWNAETGSLIRTIKGHDEDVLSVTYSPDGRYIVSGSVFS